MLVWNCVSLCIHCFLSSSLGATAAFEDKLEWLMAEILGNELLMKALGKKGWREVKHLCTCVCVWLCWKKQLRQHEAMTWRHKSGITGTTDSHLFQWNISHIYTHTHPAPSDVHVSGPTGGKHDRSQSNEMSIWGGLKHTHTSSWPCERSQLIHVPTVQQVCTICRKHRQDSASNNRHTCDRFFLSTVS